MSTSPELEVFSMLEIPFPVAPVLPVSPLSPLRLVKAKSKVLACAVPPLVTVTAGIPTVFVTLAVAPVISAFAPS